MSHIGVLTHQLFLSLFVAMSVLSNGASVAQQFEISRCEVLPLPNRQVSIRIDGQEKTRWHFSHDSPGPFLFPVTGPSGVSLTRMGHPGAENHDHHRSVWLAYQNVNGLDFWTSRQGNQIRQKHWYCYEDGDEEGVMAARLGWYDQNDNEVLDQDVVIAVRPLRVDEYEVELQLTLRPPERGSSVTLGKTNFGLLAVRVARSLSSYFGGGELTSSNGGVGENHTFGRPAKWMDYSGPVVKGTGAARHVVNEGITFHDHPANVNYPTHWHVRSDGWMGASPGMHAEHMISSREPLRLRYLLHVHRGRYDPERSAERHSAFSERRNFVIKRSGSDRPHLQYEVSRDISD